MRSLPLYFLLDTSGSMRGEPIQALNNAFSGMIKSLTTNTNAIESLLISIITFDREVKEIVSLTKLESFQLPEIICPASGPTNMGEALSLLLQKIEPQLAKRRKYIYLYHKSLLFLFIDGRPSDVSLFREMSVKLLSSEYGIKIGCLVKSHNEKTDSSWIKQFSDTILQINSYDQDSINQVYKWSTELILKILENDDDISDSFNIIDPNNPKLPQLTNRLMYLN